MLSYFSHVNLCVTLWTEACHDFLSMGFSRQEYWSRLLGPSPGDLPDPGIKPSSLALAGEFLFFLNTSTKWEALFKGYIPFIVIIKLLTIFLVLYCISL